MEALGSFTLADEVREEDRFGYGQMQFRVKEDRVEVWLYHDYGMQGKTGKKYERSEKKELFFIRFDSLQMMTPRQHLTDMVLLVETLRELLERTERKLKR